MGIDRVLRRSTGLAAGALLLAATGASAQQSVDSRWLAWVGCWEPTTASTSMIGLVGQPPVVCVVPGQVSSAVEMVSIVDGEVVSRERVEATGERMPTTGDGCTGWQSAQWSAEGTRLYLRSAAACDGGLERATTGLIAMLSPAEWVDVQSIEASGRMGMRVVRYRSAAAGRVIPDDIAAAVRGREVASHTARVIAAGDVTHADIIEASRQLAAPVVEAWLIERRPELEVSGKDLVRLAEAGVPESVLDIVVALANQDRFAIDMAARTAQPVPDSDTNVGGGAVSASYDPFYNDYFGFGRYGRYSRYSRFSRYGYYGYSPFGYSPYGYGSYYSAPPVIIITQPGSSSEDFHGRVVNGRGYTRRPSSGSAGTTSSRPSSGASTSTSSGGSKSSGASTSSGGSGSRSTGRTATRRPPPGK